MFDLIKVVKNRMTILYFVELQKNNFLNDNTIA